MHPHTCIHSHGVLQLIEREATHSVVMNWINQIGPYHTMEYETLWYNDCLNSKHRVG